MVVNRKAWLGLFFLLNGIIVEKVVFGGEKTKIGIDIACAKHYYYRHDTFHSLVTARFLSKNLIAGGRFTGINSYDMWGRLPLHYLVCREDATRDCVEGMCKMGADINVVIAWEGQFYNCHDYLRRHSGESPEGKSVTFEMCWLGNKEVKDYVFGSVLYTKLEQLDREIATKGHKCHARQFGSQKKEAS